MSAGASITLLTTDGLPERERFDFWRVNFCGVRGIDVQLVSRRPFFGEVATTQVKQFAFSHLRCQGHRCSWTRQARTEAVIISIAVRGKTRIMQDGREFVELEAGDIQFIDTTRPYVAIMDDEFEDLSLAVPREVWVRRSGPTEQITGRVVRGNTYLGRLGFAFFRQLFSGIATVEPVMADRLAEVSLTLVSTLASVFSQDVCRSSGRISLSCRAKALIEENLHDPGLNPEKIAQALKISKRYLHDLFQDEGTAVCDWMWDRRVEKCRQRLSDPLLASQSISEIAFGCGFNDFTHFGRRFKAMFSVSPSEFRREQRASKLQ